MFCFNVEDREWGLKPQNCPGHCLLYKAQRKSTHDLPVRYADFGVLHRNELSGSLRGLTRVRRFQQDDAHIFCRLDQVEEEISNCLEFLDCVYAKLGLEYEMELSTRPEKYIGDLATWDNVEQQLKNSLTKFCQLKNRKFEINPGDGAFYGPKIDIKVFDSAKREFQCGTIQLDSQLPCRERFNLLYQDEQSEWQHPVIIHRAIYGSLERMLAILTEHYNGDWPFWLSPRQIVLVPVSTKPELVAYGQQLRQLLNGYYIDFDAGQDRLNKKLVNARKSGYNYAVVFGLRDVESGTVNVNNLHTGEKQDLPLSELSDFFRGA